MESKMTKKSTVHNPTNFNPADYEVITYLDNKQPEYYGQDMADYTAEVAAWRAEMVDVLGANWHSKVHHCVHCGNGNVRWITATQHIPTGERVVFGADCTARLGFADRQAFQLAQLKARAEAGHARMKVWAARSAYLAAHVDVAAAVEQAKSPVHAKNFFVHDVIAKLNQYGSLSERQASAVIASIARDVAAAQQVVEPKGDAPTGRVTVSGVILSVKRHESDWGVSMKMTLKLDNGSRVWMTMPSGAAADRGDRITVTATFEQSQDDKSFAFGKRPVVA
jgi:hypothetical protein